MRKLYVHGILITINSTESRPNMRMDIKELAEELMIWLPKISAGKTLEIVFSKASGHPPATIENIDDLYAAAEDGDEIRIKQEEPVKCKEWWFNDYGGTKSPQQIFCSKGHALSYANQPHKGQVRVIEPLSYKATEDLIAEKADSNGCLFVPVIMHVLLKAGITEQP